MNKAQKSVVNAAADKISSMQELLQLVFNELSESFENKSEEWRESNAGEAAQIELDMLQQVLDDLSNVEHELCSLGETAP